MVKVSGFTIIKNALRLDFPVEASIRSVLPVCDEFVVNVGRSDDETLALIRGIADPKIRIIESEWDPGRRYHMLAEETQRAMRACRHPWGVYIQADEVLHEDGLEALARGLGEADPDPRVEGLAVRYRHFYGSPEIEATDRRWYRREVRAVRLDPTLGIHSYRDAQGFRVGPDDRPIRARLVNAEMFHLGWARPNAALLEKAKVHQLLYDDSGAVPESLTALPWLPLLKPFHGSHPAAVQDWLAARRAGTVNRIARRRWRWRFLRLYLSYLVERLTGWRMFEFRNYELV